jgi:hypothetical protein
MSYARVRNPDRKDWAPEFFIRAVGRQRIHPQKTQLRAPEKAVGSARLPYLRRSIGTLQAAPLQSLQTTRPSKASECNSDIEF